MTNDSKQSVLTVLIVAYVLSLSFLQVFDFPIIGSKIQPPELIFLGILAVVGIWGVGSSPPPGPLKDESDFAGGKKGKGGQPFSFLNVLRTLPSHPFRGLGGGESNLIPKALLFYFLAVLFSCLANNQLKSWLELTGLVYLILVFFIFYKYLKINVLNTSNIIFNWLPLAGVIAAVPGIAGWFLAQFDIQTQLASPATSYYPYFGNLSRAIGFTTNPNMLLSILAIAILLKFSEMLYKKKGTKLDWATLAVLGIGAILTFSKTIVVLAIGGIFVWMRFKKDLNGGVKKMLWGLMVILFLFFNFGAHIAVFDKSEVNWEKLKEKAYTEDHPFTEFQNKYLIATNYAVNKKSAVLAGIRHFPFGVGPGGHNEFVAELKEKGEYPRFFTNYDPHSTYVGAFGEVGILGILALLFLFLSVLKILRKNLRTILGVTSSHAVNDSKKALIVGLAGCFLYIAIEAITTDVMNFRHYWVLLAILTDMGVRHEREA